MLVHEIEGWGANQVVLGEHVFTSADTVHPGGAAMRNGGSPATLLIFAAIAAATSTIRLAPGILIAGLRHPVVLAKEAATLDQLSDGRLDLGLGGGWLKAEFDVLDIPFDERFARLEESIRVCRTIWAERPASFDGRFVSFEEIFAAPEPVAPRIPIWIGGRDSHHTARRIAELGDAWVTSEVIDIDTIANGRRLIHDACTRVGRDPSRIRLRATIAGGVDPASVSVDRARFLRDHARRLVDRGATDVTVALARWATSMAHAEELVGSLVADLATLRD